MKCDLVTDARLNDLNIAMLQLTGWMFPSDYDCRRCPEGLG